MVSVADIIALTVVVISQKTIGFFHLRLVTHSTAICDSIAAIPPKGGGGVKRDTLRYLENIDAIGIAIPYRRDRGGVAMLGH